MEHAFALDPFDGPDSNPGDVDKQHSCSHDALFGKGLASRYAVLKRLAQWLDARGKEGMGQAELIVGLVA